MKHILNLIVLAALAWAWASSAVAQSQVTCESRNNQRQECRLDTRGEVRLVRKLSSSSCNEGSSWGTYRGGVWVDRGCRAIFEAVDSGYGGNGHGSGGGSSRPSSTTCESRNNQRTECRIDTSGTVRLTRKMSDASCTEGTSWGTGRGFVWVDRGCRASFQASGGGSSNAGGGMHGSGPSQVTCESRGNRREECRMDTRGNVRMTRRLSNADCREGSSYGIGTGYVWVDRGCRAVFETSYSGSGSGGYDRPRPTSATCESRGNRRNECDIDTRGRVRLTRQLSSTDCKQGQSWGVGDGFVWVERGCRAVFESSRGNSGGYPSQLPEDGYNGNRGDPPSWAVRACNARNDWYGKPVSWSDLKPGAYEIILDYDREGRYVCNVESGGRVTYFEKLR